MKNIFQQPKWALGWVLLLAGGVTAIQISVAATGIQILNPSLPSGVAGFGYNVTLYASGGTNPYTWVPQAGSVLPTGFSLSPQGVLSGSATSAGSYSVAVQVTDASGKQGQQSYTFTISNSGVITTGLPSAVKGVAYQTTLSATGGVTPYVWRPASGVSGKMTSGLSLSSSGVISGTPSILGYDAFTVRATDSTGQRFTQTLGINTVTPLTISSSALPTGILGHPYKASLAASGGIGPYAWKVVSGAPPSIILIDSSGTAAGTPMVTGSYGFTVQVADASGQQTNGLSSIAITSPVTIVTASLPGGTVGSTYNSAVAASGGLAPYNWSVVAGTLPAGLSFSNSGGISGTPTTSGSSSFTLQVTDSSGGTSAQAYAVTIAPAGLAITTSSLPNGTTGVAYSATLAAAGGTGPYTWSILSGLLPTGLGLGTTTGIISGTPSTSGTYNVTMTVSDSVGGQASKLLGIVIAAGICTGCPSLTITTTAVPSGTIGTAYSSTLTATGGAPPYTWSILSASCR